MRPPGGGRVVLRTEGVTKRFGGVVAVDNVTVGFEQASVTGIIGPNGAGKTTLLNVVAGATRCDSGRVFFETKDTTSLPSFRVGQLGIARTFQMASVFSSLTTLENLLVGSVPPVGESLSSALAGPRRWATVERGPLERAWVLVEKLGLDDAANQLAGTLSGGQRRLVELARAILTDPVVLLLDEPLAGVSPSLIPRILDYLREVVSAGVTIVMIEHDLAVVESICDVVVFMANGRVIAQGEIRTLLQNEAVLAAAQGY